jgi:hypothetical protein
MMVLSIGDDEVVVIDIYRVYGMGLSLVKWGLSLSVPGVWGEKILLLSRPIPYTRRGHSCLLSHLDSLPVSYFTCLVESWLPIDAHGGENG